MKVFVDTNMLVHQIDSLLTTNIDDMKRFATKIKLIPLTPEEDLT
jgi:hypothetical protein